MALAGAPIRRRRHALVVGSNTTIVRIFQTYLDREGLNVSVSSPVGVRRAVESFRELGTASAVRVATPGSGPIAIVVLVLPPGAARTEVCGLLAVHDETEFAPMLFVQAATVPSSVILAKATPSYPVATAGHDAPSIELVWPFRLRELFEAVGGAIAAEDDRLAVSRAHCDDAIDRSMRSMPKQVRSGRLVGSDAPVGSLTMGNRGMVSA